jgi:hypothetical protein
METADLSQKTEETEVLGSVVVDVNDSFQYKTETNDTSYIGGEEGRTIASKLIGRVYPSSSEPSEYRCLIQVDDALNNDGNNDFDEVESCAPHPAVSTHFTTLDECLLQLQNDHTDLNIRKMFAQLLNCQRNTITKNLAKLESSKRALESMWETDTKLKKEELEQAEIARVEREKKEKREKMRNDIRASLGGEKRRKKNGAKKKTEVKNDENTVSSSGGVCYRSYQLMSRIL